MSSWEDTAVHIGMTADALEHLTQVFGGGSGSSPRPLTERDLG